MINAPQFAKSRGFTLVEAIVVIVITGIIGGMVAVFIRAPVQGYVDAQRRAEMTDVADTAVRRLARDIRLALPNSVRMSGDGSGRCIEFIPTKIGARYRAVVDGTGNGDPLNFAAIDNAFDMLWPNTTLPPGSQIAAGDVVVVYNDGSPNGNAYSGVNAIQVRGNPVVDVIANSTLIELVANGVAVPFDGKQLPGASPDGRFQVIPAGSHVVSYSCDNNGRLVRTSRTLNAAWGQPATCAAMVAGAAPVVTTAVLATNVAQCSLTYDPPGVSTGLSRFGIVSMSLQINDPASGESVSLYDQVHVDNTP